MINSLSPKLNEIGRFLEKHAVSKETQGEGDNLIGLYLLKKLKQQVITSPKQTNIKTGPNCFTVNFTKHFKKCHFL